MKKLEIWNDSNGKIIYDEYLDDIEKIEVKEEILYVLLKNGFSKEYSLEQAIFGYSFKIT